MNPRKLTQFPRVPKVTNRGTIIIFLGSAMIINHNIDNNGFLTLISEMEIWQMDLLILHFDSLLVNDCAGWPVLMVVFDFWSHV